MNILVVRNDKLGDFVLTLPCYALLKAAMPHAKISVLVPEYTAAIARHSPFIDETMIDPGNGSATALFQLVNKLRAGKFDAVITLFSTGRIGLAVLLAGIRYRLAPATKLAQVFYNHRLQQRRSRSEKPEYAYNLDLIRQFLRDHNIEAATEPGPPYLVFDQTAIQPLRSAFYQQHHIEPDRQLIFLHAGSGGSANNLSLQQYAKLAEKLATAGKYIIVLTAGPGEIDRVESLSRMMTNTDHVIYHSTQGLIPFAQHISFADLFIAGSTGTLHIAGALDTPTAAFYTRRQSATSLRWQTLNSPQHRLAFCPPDDAQAEDMSSIDVSAAAAAINEKFLRS